MITLKKESILISAIVLAMCILSGCSKDKVLGQYNKMVETAGNMELTSDFRLKGTRKYGSDHYVGDYNADCSDFSSSEILFGGTSIYRKQGNMIKITCKFNIHKGKIKLFLMSGSSRKMVLYEGKGIYEDTLELPAGGNYIGIKGDNFTGKVELHIE